MKKKISILLAVALCVVLMCCGCANDNANGEKEPVENNKEATADKTGMSRINIFETGVLELTTQDVDNKGTTVAAYAVKDYVDKAFAAAPADPVVLVASDGYSASTKADEFMKHFITMEGESAPLFVGPELSGELKVKYLQYIKTANESICFVADSLKVSDIFSTLGMVEADNYKFVASDGFSVEVAAADIAECTLNKKDKAVNAAIPALKGGDLRELLYIEAAK
jgi:hypothetical protein